MSNTPNTPKHTGRNTNMCPDLSPKRARAWCYTWNNHTEENWHTNTHLFEQFKIKKLICQEEKGKNGTQHIQGFIQFENAIQFETLKKIDKKIHWEVCRNIPASINYCSKKDTRDGRTYSFGIKKKKIKYEFDHNAFLKWMRDDIRNDMIRETLEQKDIDSGLIPKNNQDMPDL